MDTLSGLTRAYKRAFDRPLHQLTGEMGELYACGVLDLKRAPDGQAGYDATDQSGKLVQIKSRAPQKNGVIVPSPKGTIARFHTWEFDYALLVLLRFDYQLFEIWRCEPEKLQEAQKKVRNPRRGIPIRRFTILGEKLYPESTAP